MTWLPIIVTLALGLMAVVISLPQFDLTLRIMISVLVFLVLLVGGTVIFSRSTHFKQNSLWELYTFIYLNRKTVNDLDYDTLIRLQAAIGGIHRLDSLSKKPFDMAVRKAKEMISSPTATKLD